MADQEDVKAVLAGDKDLAQRDLRNHDFSGIDLNGANLIGAHIEGSNFTNAKLVEVVLANASGRAKTVGMTIEGADLTKATAVSGVFVNVSFKNSIFSGAVFDRSHFARTSFAGADLRNASFRNSKIMEGTDFEGALVDESTFFDGVEIFRPIARQEAFRFYEVVRGVLVRRKDNDFQSGEKSNRNQSVNKPVPAGREVPIKQIDDLLNALAPLEPAEIDLSPVSGMGHNNPPEITPIDRTEFQEIKSILEGIKIELHSDDLRLGVINDGVEKAERISSKIAAWVARKADLASDEFAKQFGKSLADGKIWMGGWLIVSGKLSGLTEVLGNLIQKIPH